MDRIELYNRMTPAWFVIVAVKLGGGVALAGATAVGMASGKEAQPLLVGLACAAALIGFGLHDLSRLTDRKAQLTLTSEGLLDHRMSRPLLLPWSAVTTIFHSSMDGHSLHIETEGLDVARYAGPGTARAPLSGKTINVQLDHVDVSFDALERAVHKVAPQVVFSSLTRKPHDARGRVG